jgi:urease accessory protein
MLVLSAPLLAGAHPALPGHTHGFASGLLHPLTGWDHLLAMTAVGVWAVGCGRRAMRLLPLAFVSTMIVGGMLGMAGLGRVPLIEQGIAASVLILGIFIAMAAQLPLPAGAFIVGMFALFHGYAHGSEMPATASGWLYGVGFVLATLGLQVLGIGLGLTAQRLNSWKLVRCAGAAIAVCGVYLLCTA